MEDEAPNAMNLNLNLGLNGNSSNDEPEVGLFTHEAINSEPFLGDPISRITDAVRQRQRRREPWRPLWRQLRVSPGSRNSGLGLNDMEDSITITAEEMKKYDKNDVFLDEELLGKENHEEKGNDDKGSFFDCNICLDLANDPVVTCCGHLFCWTCVYKWLHFHSDAKECPVCKGEVTLKNVTPIYGRGESVINQQIDDINLKIPNRPQAQRVESWRQVMRRSDIDVQMEEVVMRRLVNRRSFRSRVQPQNDDDALHHESPERSNIQLNPIPSYRFIRREPNPEILHHVFDDLSQRNPPANSEPGESSQVPSYLQRMNSNLAVVLSNLSTLGSENRVVESYLPNDTLETNHYEPTQPVNDRDSMSSIAAIIHSESQTVETQFENDSTVFLSTSSSRSRNNGSIISDVNSGDSRAPRRRRMN